MNRQHMAAPDASAVPALASSPSQALTIKPDGAHAPDDPSARTERIREEAYRLYQARGHADGHAVEDWLAAEAALAAAPGGAASAASTR